LPASIERRVEKDAKATRAEEKRAIVATAARTATVRVMEILPIFILLMEP
jgi:hypothetical protein